MSLLSYGIIELNYDLNNAHKLHQTHFMSILQTQTERVLPVMVMEVRHGGETRSTEASSSEYSSFGRGMTAPSKPSTSSSTAGAACFGGKLSTWAPLREVDKIF
jgi:hypothetical protein